MLGGFDSFALYNITLTAEEVASNYASSISGVEFDKSEKGLVLYLDFDDPDLSNSMVAVDRVSKTFNGTLAYDGKNGEGKVPSCSFEEGMCAIENSRTAPIQVCHDQDSPFCSAEQPNRPPSMRTDSPAFKTSCEKDSSTEIMVNKFAFDLDGDWITPVVTRLPAFGTLSERSVYYDRTTRIKIDNASLPYALRMNFSSLEYNHSTKFGQVEFGSISSMSLEDSFEFHFTDGSLSSTSARFPINLVGEGSPPVTSNNVSSRSLKIKDGRNVSFEVDFVDFTSPVVSVLLIQLPSNGSLFLDVGQNQFERLPEAFSQHPYRGDIVIHYAEEVVNVSSYWNSENGFWGAERILGEGDCDLAYSDCEDAWCPSQIGGTGKANNTYNKCGETFVNPYASRFWDAASTYKAEGYTEFIEVRFPEPLFITDVEIGEPRGCGSIVRILAREYGGSSVSTFFTQPPDTSCDAEDGLQRLGRRMKFFVPSPTCHSPFLSDTIRIELDTRLVEDWNELDFVKVSGYREAPKGVVFTKRSSAKVEFQDPLKLVYVPIPDFTGTDSFIVGATDCPYTSLRRAEPINFSVEVNMANIICPPGSYEKNRRCHYCAPGSYSEREGSKTCSLCPIDTSNSAEGSSNSTACEKCAEGMGSNYHGASACECNLGYFSDGRGCVRCKIGEFKDHIGSAGCIPCNREGYREGSVTLGEGSRSINDCICPKNKYLNKENTECVPIEEGMADDVGMNVTTLNLTEGFWRTSNTSVKVEKCAHKDHCLGGSDPEQDESCTDGHEGPLCAVCAPDFARYSLNGDLSKCEECSGSVWPAIVASGFVLLLGGILYLTVVTSRKRDDAPDDAHEFREMINDHEEKASCTMVAMTASMTVFKMCFSYLQIVSGFSFGLDLTFTKKFTLIMQWVARIATIDIIDVMPLNCAMKSDFFLSLVLYTALPLIVMLLMLLIWLFLVLRMRWSSVPEGSSVRERVWQLMNRKKKNPAGRSEDESKETKHLELWEGRFFKLSLILTFLVLPAASVKISSAFECKTFDGEYGKFLKVDYSIDCNSSYYHDIYRYARVMVFFYPVGIPFTYLFLLCYHYIHKAAKEKKKAGEVFSRHDGGSGSVSCDVFRDLMKALGTNCEEERETIKKLAVDGCISKPDFVEWYVEWLFDESQENKSHYFKSLQFISGSYKRECWWFEVVETSRRLALSFGLSYLPFPGTAWQIIVSMVCCLFFLKIHAVWKPFKDDHEGRTAEILQWQLFFTLFAALCIRLNLNGETPQDKETFDICLLIIQFAPIGIQTIYHFLIEKKIYRRCIPRGNNSRVSAVASIEDFNGAEEERIAKEKEKEEGKEK